MEIALTIIVILIIIVNVFLFIGLCRNSKELIRLIQEWKEKINKEGKQ